MALWGSLGQLANIVQIGGVDVFGLIALVVEGEQTVRRNKEACERLALRAAKIRDLLQQLQDLKDIEHLEKWKPTQGLKGTLRNTYVLIRTCQRSSYAYRFCMGCELEGRLESVEKLLHLYHDHLSGRLWYVHFKEFTIVADDIKEIKVDVKHMRETMNVLDEIAIALNMNMLIGGEGSGLTKFSFSALERATNNFSLENEIGFGGSCTVYKARLPGGREVAVKRASYGAKTQFHHFETELELIPKLRHANIVKLLGYCLQKNERILVLEYMPNGSLESFIYGKRASEGPLTWPQRSRIVEAVAQGALYLHELCGQRIIHGDLKPGNILLDSDLNPKICDFGISRELKPDADKDCTAIVTGSRGFIAPEYKEGGCVSVKSDVYGFGATLLQIISGKKFPPPPLALSDESRDYGPLNNWAWGLWRERRLMEFIDSPLHNYPRTAEIERWFQIALLCVQQNPDERPSMRDILVMLSCESVILREPNEPAYC